MQFRYSYTLSYTQHWSALSETKVRCASRVAERWHSICIPVSTKCNGLLGILPSIVSIPLTPIVSAFCNDGVSKVPLHFRLWQYSTLYRVLFSAINCKFYFAFGGGTRGGWGVPRIVQERCHGSVCSTKGESGCLTPHSHVLPFYALAYRISRRIPLWRDKRGK